MDQYSALIKLHLNNIFTSSDSASKSLPFEKDAHIGIGIGHLKFVFSDNQKILFPYCGEFL